MSHRYESPKNLRKTNPMNFLYEDVKEKHYLAKYRPDEDEDNTDFRDNNDISCFPETSAFNFCDNEKGNNLKDIPKFEECENKGLLRFKTAIKSCLIPS